MEQTKARIDAFIASMLTRKFFISVLGSAFTVLNYVFGWGFTVEQMTVILTPLGGFVVFEGIADIVQRAKLGTNSTTIVKTSQTASSEVVSDDSVDKSQILTGAHRIKTADEITEE